VEHPYIETNMKNTIQDQSGGNMKTNKIIKGRSMKTNKCVIGSEEQEHCIRIQNLGDDMHLCPIFRFKQTPMSP
jgi:hypothetical protein